MSEMPIYVADDGSRWDTPGLCEARERENARARADTIVRWQHTYQASSQLPAVFGERIDPDDGHEFCGPWEPVGCAVDPHWQSRGEVVPTLVTLWRRPLRRVE